MLPRNQLNWMVVSMSGTITNNSYGRFKMISVGIDVSKGKSTVCVLKPYGEIVCKSFEIHHVEKDLEDFHKLLQILDGKLRIVMEATGVYHLPVLMFFHG